MLPVLPRLWSLLRFFSLVFDLSPLTLYIPLNFSYIFIDINAIILKNRIQF